MRGPARARRCDQSTLPTNLRTARRPPPARPPARTAAAAAARTAPPPPRPAHPPPAPSHPLTRTFSPAHSSHTHRYLSPTALPPPPHHRHGLLAVSFVPTLPEPRPVAAYTDPTFHFPAHLSFPSAPLLQPYNLPISPAKPPVVHVSLHTSPLRIRPTPQTAFSCTPSEFLHIPVFLVPVLSLPVPWRDRPLDQLCLLHASTSSDSASTSSDSASSEREKVRARAGIWGYPTARRRLLGPRSTPLFLLLALLLLPCGRSQSWRCGWLNSVLQLVLAPSPPPRRRLHTPPPPFHKARPPPPQTCLQACASST